MLPPNQPTFDLSRRQQPFRLLEPDTHVDAIITIGGLCLPVQTATQSFHRVELEEEVRT